MDAPLIQFRSVLAEEISRRRSRPDPVADWYWAEEELVKKRAYDRSQKLPEASLDSEGNWFRAKDIVQWRIWVESQFSNQLIRPFPRPYLALVTHHREALVSRLNSLCELNSNGTATGIVAVLDGGPENARHSADDSTAFETIAAKDSTFFEYCRHTVSLFRGKLLEGGQLRSCDDVVEGDRAFQDGCLGAFASPTATCDAIIAALHLRVYLSSLNYRNEVHWPNELHLRVVIASSWEATLKGLQYARRDEIVVEDLLFASLEPCTKRTLLAAGIELMKARKN